MAFWLKYRIKRFLSIWLSGGCVEDYILHCWHHRDCKIPADRHCFESRAKEEYVEGWQYECCRCHKRTEAKKVKHSGY